MHLVNKCCWGQTGLSVPVVPLHGHFSSITLLNIPLRQIMNGKSSTYQSRENPKIYQILFQKFCKSKCLGLFFLFRCPFTSARFNTSLKMLPPVLLFIYCTLHFFQRIISNKNLKNKMFSCFFQFAALVASKKSKKSLVALPRASG